MSAVELKTSVKTQFDLKELKCLNPESSSLSGGPIKNTPPSRPMGDLENNGDPQRFNMDEDKSKLTKVEKFSYPVHRKRPRFLSQSRAADNHHNKKRAKRNEKIILPTKFLLGGNINDPLNLNSLCDEGVNRAQNERTPQSSPVPTPAHRRGDVTLVMPRNQFDPLNLNEPDLENEPLSSSMVCAKRKKRHKSRKKNDSNIENTSAPTTPLITKESEKKKNLAEALKIEIDDDSSSLVVVESVKQPPQDKPRTPQVPTSLSVSSTVLLPTGGTTTNSEVADTPKVKSENKIVSPVIPQLPPKNRKRRQTSICESRSAEPNPVSNKNLNRSESCPGEINKTTFTRKNKRRYSNRGNKKGQLGKSKSYRFIYGNYSRYYGYRNTEEHDSRTNEFKLEWFEDKKVLDIGCNVGHLTLLVARDFKPEMILGLDIDGRLISAARKNIRHYLIHDDQNKYPSSCKLSYGPLAAPVKQENRDTGFPHNVTFAQGSYVLESDELLEIQKPQYDMILCMSITKWIHLNWGDEGLKRSFKRMYCQLRPGGRLILEPQSWCSYKKRKGLTDAIYKNFCSIKFKPDNFADYLTSPEVGFSNYEIIDVPFNKSKGFQRPIYMFYKDDGHPMTRDGASQVPNSHTLTSTQLMPPPQNCNRLMDWSASEMSHFPSSLDVSLLPGAKDMRDSSGFLYAPNTHVEIEEQQMTTDSPQKKTDPSLAVSQEVANGNPDTQESTLELSAPLSTSTPSKSPRPSSPPPPPSSSLGVSSSLAIDPSLSSSSSVTVETEASTPTAESKSTETTQRSGDI